MPLEALKGKTPEHNANALVHALSGADSAYRRAVLYNAAAGLVIAGKAADLKAGAAMAKGRHRFRQGACRAQKLVELSNGNGGI